MVFRTFFSFFLGIAFVYAFDTNFIEEYFWKTKSIPYTIFEKNETIKLELREILNETLERFQKDINSSLIEWNEIPCNIITSYDRYVVFNLADPSFPCGLSDPSSSHQNTIQFSTKPECDYSDHLIHILSILGFISPHLRQDRDNFVNIHFENIFPFYHQLFDKCENCLNSSNNAFEKYDYNSILHLPKFSRFTINKSLPTITEKAGNNLLPISYNYTGRSLSAIDIAIIKAIYL
uniref:Peptidase M12A domain-containing protein n=1 Tax=Panagrolaimus sp. PS1159 TaxID=55785 RepID=A0AC35G6U4_9BILA